VCLHGQTDHSIYRDAFTETGGELEGVAADTVMLEWPCFESTA